jgi:hypothetical protein
MKNPLNPGTAIALVMATGILTACGGGGSGSSSSPSAATQPSISVYAGQVGNAGSVTGPLGNAIFDAPLGMIADNAGNLYVADYNADTISKISNGTVTILAGAPYQQGAANGTGASASFGGPNELAIDPSGNLYVTDDVPNSDSESVRKITPSGQVTTIMNPTTGQALLTDGSTGITADSQSNVYVFTTNASTGASQLTQITPAGAVNTITLTNTSGAPIGLVNPQNLAIDTSNNLYISDDDNEGNAGALYRVALSGTTGQATLMAGSVTTTGANDGPGSTATFSGLANLTVDSSGNVFANDSNNYTIREISPAGVVTTLAGIAGQDTLDLGTLPQPLPDLDALLWTGQKLYASAPDASVLLQISPVP